MFADCGLEKTRFWGQSGAVRIRCEENRTICRSSRPRSRTRESLGQIRPRKSMLHIESQGIRHRLSNRLTSCHGVRNRSPAQIDSVPTHRRRSQSVRCRPAVRARSVSLSSGRLLADLDSDMPRAFKAASRDLSEALISRRSSSNLFQPLLGRLLGRESATGGRQRVCWPSFVLPFAVPVLWCPGRASVRCLPLSPARGRISRKTWARGSAANTSPRKPRKQPIFQLSILPGAGSLLPNDPLP